MKYVRFGNTGLKVSPLCLGCMTFGGTDNGHHSWTIDEAASRPIIRQALEAGINFFDTANIYSNGESEQILGRALHDFAQREEVVITTKACGPWRQAPNTAGLSRKALLQSIDDSLLRLGTDYVDLLVIHRWDYHTPIEETLETLNDIVRAGKALYIGASSMLAWQFCQAMAISEKNGWSKFVSMQNHLNLLYREEEREMLSLCADQKIAVTPWSPLARGRLTRDWNESSERSESDAILKLLYQKTADSDRKVIEAVSTIARQRDIPHAQVALAWLAAKAEVTAPIVGARQSHHLSDAIASLELELSDDEINALEAPYVPHAVAGLEIPPAYEETLSLS